ncbi:MAG: S-methyl-5-thioribose-1-phosphate isomerase [archaeon]
MKVKLKNQSKNFRTVWFESPQVVMIDQPKLPFKFAIKRFKTYKETAKAISDMIVRGAPAIGATAAYATAQAVLEFKGEDVKKFDDYMRTACKLIKSARPTAIDLAHATDRVYNAVIRWDNLKQAKMIAVDEAEKIADEYISMSRRIGEHGAELIQHRARILTHCNAGWLATVDWGTALAPIFTAHRSGTKLFVFVDETRPRLQGARLTAWELAQEGIDHAIIADNAAGYYMRKGEVDMCIVGADRIAANGDVANKIGTYEKAVVAKEHGIPFYVAAPKPTFDFECKTGDEIPIEERNENEVKKMWGKEGIISVANPGSPAKNPAFDITPSKFVTGYITEIGILKANQLSKLG